MAHLHFNIGSFNFTHPVYFTESSRIPESANK
ncbi:unnamed protein product [Strongylus vulgaris]|uniref:Uncharacterized protein n=1 Tax=Strongylus vulgaris TaxID=40348 RepID=A0A3P7K9A2_STRVU|nr:unnamed protein product [Strongylus vulgaris]